MATYNPETGEILPRVYDNHEGKYLTVYHDGKLWQAGRFAWAQMNGDVPKHHRVRFKDGDRTNLKYDNLYLDSASKKPTFDAEWFRANYTYDPDTGEIISHHTKRPINPETSESGYLRFWIRGRNYKVHRLAWLHKTGVWPNGVIDHKDEDKTNNRWDNLQELTDEENNMRKRAKIYKPFKTESGRWSAHTVIGGKDLSLGTYDTQDEAVAAYQGARLALRQLVDAGRILPDKPTPDFL